MKLRDMGLCWLGGSVLYVTMAACAGKPAGPVAGSGGRGGTVTVHEGEGGAGRGGKGGANGAGGNDGGLADVLTNPVPDASADPAPGSRLKPKYWLGDDGAKQYMVGSWFDSTRNEDCSFALAADGKMRCLPQAMDFGYYSDVGCNTPMIMTQGSCAPPKYGISVSDADCGFDPSKAHVYSVGTAMTPTNIYAKSGAGCFAIGPAESGYSYYSVGAEIAPTEFVAVNLGHD